MIEYLGIYWWVILMKGELNILHLSDLHIEDQSSDGQNEISVALKNLIFDIKEKTQKIKELIIVLSGDVLYQAQYEKNQNTAVKFFELLNVSISSTVKGIVIVPGNHDIERGVEETNIIKNKNLSQASDNNSLQFLGYDKYLTLVNKIRRIFGLKTRKQKTYGVELFDCNNLNVAFQYIDTAWGVLSKTTKGEIEVGKTQLKYIEKQYKNKVYEANRKQPIDLTIAVMHYPLSWLNADDANGVINSMMDVSFLNTNVLLCGHIHDAEVLNYVNHEHSLITLATGIGWGINKPSDAKDQHRYSIYKLNLSNNVCEVIMRRSQQNQKFDYDYTVYTEETEKNEKKIVYPLKMNNTTSFLKMNTCQSEDIKSIQVSKDVLGKISFVAQEIANFREACTRNLECYKRYFLENISNESLVDDKEKFYSAVKDFLYDNIELNGEFLKSWKGICDLPNAKETFESFLKDICRSFIAAFEDIFPKKTVLRTHFRKHIINDGAGEYIMICEDNNGGEVKMPPKVVPWGGMIKHSYDDKKSLIYSVNSELNHIETNWDDFLTLIPTSEGNEIEIRIQNGKNKILEKRPVISFGVSFKNKDEAEKGTIILAIMSFLEIEKQVSYFVDEYIRMFNLTLRKIYN